MDKNKRVLKPWKANLIAFFTEIVIIFVYFLLCADAIDSTLSGDISGAFDEVIVAIWFLNIAILATSICYFVIKPMRTKTTRAWAIFNLIWIVGNIVMMLS